MIAVSNQNGLGLPAAFVAFGSAKADAPVGTDAGAEFAFHQMFDACDAKANLSVVPFPDQTNKELLLKEGAEDGFYIDLACADLLILPPIAQILASLPLPTAPLPEPTVPAADPSKPALDGAATGSTNAAGSVLPGIPDEIEGDALQHAQSDHEITQPTEAISSIADGVDPESLSPATEEKHPLAFTAATEAVARPNAPDLPPTTRLPVEANAQQLPNTAERIPQAFQAAGAAPADPQITIEYPKSSAHFSTAENTWRQKWSGEATAATDVEDSAAYQTLAADQDDGSNPQALQFVSNKGLALSAPIAAPSAPFAWPPGDAASNAAPIANLSPKPATAEKLQGRHGPDLSGFNHASNARDIEIDAGSALSPPEIDTTVSAPRHLASSVIAPAPTASMPNQSAHIATRIAEMSKTRDNGPVDVSLAPEELGKLTISIKQEGNFVHVTLTAERPETLDLMRRNANDLVADLRQTGFSGASLSFGQGQKDQHPNFQNTNLSTGNQQSPQSLPPETKPIASSRTLNGAGVDLRF